MLLILLTAGVSMHLSKLISDLKPSDRCIGYIRNLNETVSGVANYGDAEIEYLCREHRNERSLSNGTESSEKGSKIGFEMWRILSQFFNGRAANSDSINRERIGIFNAVISVLVLIMVMVFGPVLCIRHWSEIKRSFHYASWLHKSR